MKGYKNKDDQGDAQESQKQQHFWAVAEFPVDIPVRLPILFVRPPASTPQPVLPGSLKFLHVTMN